MTTVRTKKRTKKTAKKPQKKQTKPKTPHVEVIGDSLDPKKGLRLELDWNDEFIDQLKQNGFTGVTDEAIVQKWLAGLYAHLIKQLNADNKSEFE